jgi:hypothetical protein
VDGPGEDHGLWRRLQGAGHPVVQPTDVAVRTSARLHGRAAGGLADLLRALHTAPARWPPTVRRRNRNGRSDGPGRTHPCGA